MESLYILAFSSLVLTIVIGVVIGRFFRKKAIKEKTAQPGSKVRKPNFLDINEDGGFHGMRNWSPLARWVITLPAALLGLILATFLVRLFISNLHEENMLSIYLLQPLGIFLSHFGFVVGGWASAPRWRIAVAVALGAALLIVDFLLLQHGSASWPLILCGTLGIAISVLLAAKSKGQPALLPKDV
jgi:hypothetical protein